eukprot:SAG31_NODE_2479_length_5631_cov_99.073325_3_plen_232_part_00
MADLHRYRCDEPCNASQPVRPGLGSVPSPPVSGCPQAEDEIENDEHFVGRAVDNWINIAIPWKRVKQGAYFITVINEWDDEYMDMGKYIDVQHCDLNYRLVRRPSVPLRMLLSCNIAREDSYDAMTQLPQPPSTQVARLNSEIYDARWKRRKQQLFEELRNVRVDLDTLEQACIPSQFHPKHPPSHLAVFAMSCVTSRSQLGVVLDEQRAWAEEMQALIGLIKRVAPAGPT